ncbi:hypothetical protein GQ44DRAFT_146065 [Phaeosphaeriaceae sp. PMI808]|nr:hypothetical protein GQ44DRAFT_138155 [Phaeosphaeriaceae sp. PMI808]KAH8727032.1 hypothetical protein GQ44DRAFT_146065 [Phaeosphaeriaceae sp. PMI808]
MGQVPSFCLKVVKQARIKFTTNNIPVSEQMSKGPATTPPIATARNADGVWHFPLVELCPPPRGACCPRSAPAHEDTRPYPQRRKIRSRDTRQSHAGSLPQSINTQAMWILMLRVKSKTNR